MNILTNKYFKNKIERNLEEIPLEAKKDFEKVKEVFDLDKIDIIGGFVRDSILQILYDYKFPVKDLDILIEDFDFENKTKGLPQKNRSRFGGLKFKYENFSMDFFGLENIFYLRDNPGLEKNLDNVLKGCDLTTSAFGYNLGERKLCSYGAIEDILEKEINVRSWKYIELAPTISRLILHSDKMGFKIGDSGIKYVRENYSSRIDNEILKFLEDKENSRAEELFELVKKSVEIIL